MSEYLLPIIITIAMCFFFLWIIKNLNLPCDGGAVEIIIDGNENAEDLEKLILSSKYVAENYFVGAKIYLSGDSQIVDTLCRQHKILKKG